MSPSHCTEAGSWNSPSSRKRPAPPMLLDANARRRFSAIPAPRTRPVGQHGENLRRAARQIHHMGGEGKADGLEIGRSETSHGVPTTRAFEKPVAGGASVLASRT